MSANIRRILITGIGGFIGIHAARRAHRDGIEVTGIEVDPGRADFLKMRLPGITVITGDMLDESVRTQALASEPDVVLNTAAVVNDTGTWKVFRELNVFGAVRMAEDAKRMGVAQFIQLSSMMVYGFNYPDRVDESGPLSSDDHPYCGTKIEGERALKLLQSDQFEIKFIRPGDVYGSRSVPWIERPMKMMKKGQFYLVGGGKGTINANYVENLIDAIFLCIEHGRNGEAYNITDDAPMTFGEYFTALASKAGLRKPRSLPYGLLRVVTGISASAARIMGATSELNPQALRFVMRPHAISIEKARVELHYEPKVGFKEGMDRTFGDPDFGYGAEEV